MVDFFDKILDLFSLFSPNRTSVMRCAIYVPATNCHLYDRQDA